MCISSMGLTLQQVQNTGCLGLMQLSWTRDLNLSLLKC